MADLRVIHLLALILITVFQQHGAQADTKGCKEKVADVVFLLDSSFSIWPERFQTQLAFVKDMVNSFTISPNNIRVGVLTFSTDVRLDMTLNEHRTKEDIQRAIGQIQYMKGGTNTGDAIKFAHTEMFMPEKGGRPWAAHVVILITDGLSTNQTQTRLEALTARSKGIEMFAIGVGERIQGEAVKELKAIASSPHSSYMFRVDNYESLKHIQESLTSKTCHQPGTTDSSTEIEEEDKDEVTKRCENQQAEVYFLLDSSSSIWRVQFQAQLHFLSQLLPCFNLGPDSTRVGVAVYSNDVHNIVSLDDPQKLHSIKAALKSSPYTIGNTNTAGALRFVRTQGFRDARPDVPRIVVLLTDGQSRHRQQVLEEARKLRVQGVYLFAIGVGSQNNVDVGELMDIASDPNENFVYHVDEYTKLSNIRELLAMKICAVQVPDYQGDSQYMGDCRVTHKTDLIFVYDSASVDYIEGEAITDTIKDLVGNIESELDAVRFGLLRENCHKSKKPVDLHTGARSKVLLSLLRQSHHEGLHRLLKRVRLEHYLSSYDKKRSDARKVIVLFMGTKLAHPVAVETEMKRLKFQKVRLLVVAVDKARDSLSIVGDDASVPPVEVESFDKLRYTRDELHARFCELNSLPDD